MVLGDRRLDNQLGYSVHGHHAAKDMDRNSGDQSHTIGAGESTGRLKTELVRHNIVIIAEEFQS